LRASRRGDAIITQTMFLITNDYWKVKKTKEKGRGVFAEKIIPAGTIIGDYIGKVIKTAEYDLDLDKKGLYLMYFSDRASIYPDLKKPGIYLLNHSCIPNCWMYTYRGHTLFFALRDISPGEELTISYLLSPKTDACQPCTHTCKCESELCTGSMHIAPDKYEIWQKFQDGEKRKTRNAKIVYGKDLSPLNSCPKIDSESSIYKRMISP